MNRIRYRYLLFIVPALLLASMAFVSPQTDLPQRLASYLNTFRARYAPEKVYVQFDKPYYAPGQTIWLKGYVVDAATDALLLKARCFTWTCLTQRISLSIA